MIAGTSRYDIELLAWGSRSTSSVGLPRRDSAAARLMAVVVFLRPFWLRWQQSSVRGDRSQDAKLCSDSVHNICIGNELGPKIGAVRPETAAGELIQKTLRVMRIPEKILAILAILALWHCPTFCISPSFRIEASRSLILEAVPRRSCRREVVGLRVVDDAVLDEDRRPGAQRQRDRIARPRVHGQRLAVHLVDQRVKVLSFRSETTTFRISAFRS